jgi:hypothetical protein
LNNLGTIFGGLVLACSAFFVYSGAVLPELYAYGGKAQDNDNGNIVKMFVISNS